MVFQLISPRSQSFQSHILVALVLVEAEISEGQYSLK